MQKLPAIVYGYKCFNRGLTNRYGEKFEIGKVYHCDGEIKFGNEGNGFHMALNLEDTLKYFDQNIDIAYVKCYGKYDEIPDTKENEENDNYDMFAFEYMVIEKVLTREEIIAHMLGAWESSVIKFIMYFKLTLDEKKLFREKFKTNTRVQNYLTYYQDGDTEVFNRQYKGRGR